MSYKADYNRAKQRYDTLTQNVADIKAKQKVARSELKKVVSKLRELTKAKDPQQVLEQLEKEIETRLEMVNDKVREFEEVLEHSPPEPSDEGVDDILGKDFEL